MTKLFLGLAFVLLVGFTGWALFKGSPSSSADPLSCKDCNVIIIGVDTQRADHVHAFGYPKETTPHIDALARQGWSFTNAISPSNWTVPSFMSMMTGLYPSQHKVVNKYVVFNAKEQKISNLKELSPRVETLAEALKKNSYSTGGFTGDAGVGHAFGYSQGFDTYTDEQAFGGFATSSVHALSWLDSLPKNQKFFMFLHGYDLHGQSGLSANDRIFVPHDYKGPYTGTPQEEAALREAQLTPAGIKLTDADAAFWTGLYDSKLHAADARLGEFLAELDRRGLTGKTIIVLVADHGEEYNEHGGIDHGQSLYDELVHVPIIIKMPNSTGGQTIPAQVSTMDVAPTVFQLLGISPDSTFAEQQKGESLVAYLSGEKTAGRDVFLETDYRDFLHERAVRTADGWKYIRNFANGKEELYDLNTDAAEKNNLISSHAAKATELKNALFGHIENDLHADPSAHFDVGCLPVYPTECK